MTTLIGSFGYTGAAQTFVVPLGVFHIDVRVVSGAGGAGFQNTYFASNGNFDLYGVNVTPGDELQINVGGDGEDATGPAGGAGGWNGGGNGGDGSVAGGGGGGGATDIREAPYALANRIVSCAGGGGSGGRLTTGVGSAPGFGNHPTGGGGGAGASATGGGAGDHVTVGSAGGVGATAGDAGTLGAGGNGGTTLECGGGGGSAGWAGGGGGQASATSGAGGGGGSSLERPFGPASYDGGNDANEEPARVLIYTDDLAEFPGQAIMV